MVGKIEKAFAKVLTGKKSAKLPVHESQKAPAVMVEYKETDQTHLVIAVRSFSVKDPRIPVMSVLSAILDGGMSSRLFRKMRQELGICYYVNGTHDVSTDHGNFAISAGVDNSRVELAVRSSQQNRFLTLNCRKPKTISQGP
jgi:predicted Zn-dependent peptidase